MTKATEQYNGWTNRETWSANLYLNNDQAAYNTCVAMTRDCEGRKGQLADRLQAYIAGAVMSANAHPLYDDLLAAAQARISWTEIAESFLEA